MLILAGSLVAAGSLPGADAAQAQRRTPKAAARAQAGVAGPQGGVAAFERVLTDDQRRQLREAMQAQGGKMRSNQQQAAALRRELQDAVLKGEADEGAIRGKAEAIAKLEAETLTMRMTAMAKIAGTLSAEQKEKIKELSGPVRAMRPGLGAGSRAADAPRLSREPAAPPPPEK